MFVQVCTTHAGAPSICSMPGTHQRLLLSQLPEHHLNTYNLANRDSCWPQTPSSYKVHDRATPALDISSGRQLLAPRKRHQAPAVVPTSVTLSCYNPRKTSQEGLTHLFQSPDSQNSNLQPSTYDVSLPNALALAASTCRETNIEPTEPMLPKLL
jgi:hypothetical protein